MVSRIKIDGGACTLDMETGVVESQFLNYGHLIGELPQNFTTGIRHDTTRTLAYHEAFTKVSEDGLYKTNPGKNSTGQLAGILSYGGRFAGRLPVSTLSRAFSPGKEEKTVGGVKVWVDKEKDDFLWMKKFTVANCPASVFTGRCRLYVQALYGLPLYKNEADAKAGKANMPYGVSMNSYQHQPVLSVRSYVSPEDKESYADVQITTSCGVWLDRTTGKHWLMDIQGVQVVIYPLVPSACARSASKFLKLSSTLNDSDRHNLEAYILSTCLPDRRKMQVVPHSVPTAGTSMGYGWHWNYSGTCADIVRNETVAVNEDDHTGSRVLIVKSTHFRITHQINRTPNDNPEAAQQTWAITHAVVSGPNRWGVERGQYCIVAPVGPGMLEKQTPFRLNSYSPTNMYVGSSPFYVYYVEDTLKRCTVTVEYFSAIEKTIRSSDISEVYPHSGAYVMNVRGEGGSAWLEVEENTGDYWRVTFTVDSVSHSMWHRRILNGWRREAGNSTRVGPEIAPYYQAPGSYDQARQFRSGDPIGSSSPFNWNYAYIVCRGYVHGGSVPCEVTKRLVYINRYFYSNGAVIVPHNDAQAAFTYARTWEVKDQLASQTDIGSHSVVGSAYPVFVSEGVATSGALVYFGNWWNAAMVGSIPGRTTYDPDTTGIENNVDTKHLVCSAGAIATETLQPVVDAVLHNMIEDFVFADTNTYTCAYDKTVAISPGLAPQRGVIGSTTYPNPNPLLDDGGIFYPVMVGAV